jgi:hypothetical protein
MAQPLDPASLEANGDVFPVAEQVSRDSGTSNGFYRYSVSGNRMLVYETRKVRKLERRSWAVPAEKQEVFALKDLHNSRVSLSTRCILPAFDMPSSRVTAFVPRPRRSVPLPGY